MAKNRHSKSNKSLSGAVLIMVLTVMFVLLIMLLATLTVVSTAQNKYYTKYEENQAYYTARSALDLYTQNLLTDKYYIAQDAIGQKVYNYTHKKSDGTTETKTKPMKQGLALELELYKAKAQKSITYTNFGTMDFANITNTDGVFTAGTPEAGYYTNSGSAAPDSLTYQIEFPKIDGVTGTGSSSTDYGRFVDVDDSTGIQIATITVEVLEREFNMSPVYTEAQIAAANNTTTPSIADIKKAIADGDRAKDRMKLKVTSTVKFMGMQSTATLIYNTSEPVIIPTGKAMTSFGAIDLNNLTILGGASTVKDSVPKNTGVVYGGLYAGKDLHNENGGSGIPLTKKQVIYVGGDYSWENAAPASKVYKTTGRANDEIPMIYVGGVTGATKIDKEDGTFENKVAPGRDWAGGSSGTVDGMVDLVTHGMKISSNQMKINGNLYSKGDVEITSNNADAIQIYNGAAYIKGHLKLLDASINPKGAFYVDGDITLPETCYDKTSSSLGDTYTLKATLPADFTFYCSGAIHPREDPSAVITKPSTNNLTAAYDWSKIDFDTTKMEPQDIFLPKFSGGSLVEDSASGKRQVETYLSEYSPYLKRDTAGNLIPDGTDYERISAEEWAGTPDEEDRKAGNYNAKNFSPTGLKEIKMRSNGSGMTVDGTDQGDYELNCASSASYLLKSCGTDRNNGLGGNSGYLHISGGGVIDLYLEASGSYGGKIVVDDDTTLNVYAPQGNYQWHTEVYNKTVYDIYTANGELKFGDDATALTAPKINFYIGGTKTNKSTWDMNAAGKCLITGYIYAPFAEFTANQGVKNMNWKYDGSETGSAQFFVIGSIIAGKIDTGSNTTGVAYVDPSKSNDTPGDPKFTWAAYLYTHD